MLPSRYRRPEGDDPACLGAVFPPPLAPVKWTYPSPRCRPSSALGARPVRVGRHNPWSIATLRKPSPEFCSGNLRVVLFVELLYNTVVLAACGKSHTGRFRESIGEPASGQRNS